MRADRILGAYRWIVVAIIVALSVRAVMHASDVADHHFWLAAIEIVAALLLLPRRTQQLGLGLLLAVFCVAGVHDLVTGSFPFTLILLAASTTTIVLLDRAIR